MHLLREEAFTKPRQSVLYPRNKMKVCLCVVGQLLSESQYDFVSSMSCCSHLTTSTIRQIMYIMYILYSVNFKPAHIRCPRFCW